MGLFTKLLYEHGETCTSNGLYCFSGLPGADAFEVFDVNADDQWSSLYGVDTRYGGGAGVAGSWDASDIEKFEPKAGGDFDYYYPNV